LRQNLKTITGLPEDSELSQAQAYYNLFSLGPNVRITCNSSTNPHKIL
jgi:hypothetical protein